MDNCKLNVHCRVTTTEIHKIVDIKNVDFSQPKESSVDLNKIPCKTHLHNRAMCIVLNTKN